MPRAEYERYPDYQAEIDAIDTEGISDALLNHIIDKHRPNAMYNYRLYTRYATLAGAVPIFLREPRFEEENPLNNRINNDFFGEIVDFKTGYFAGKPAVYMYADSTESKEDTGGDEARDDASKALSDFVARNNMADVDMDVTKYAAIAGYAGRMFYIDTDKHERVMALPAHETIVLSPTDITEPRYGIRYYKTQDLNGAEMWRAEFDDGKTVRFYEGMLGALLEIPEAAIPNAFGYCAIQGVPNNTELMGDAEKVLELIDAYDRATSDINNEVEGFANAYMGFENVDISDDQIAKGQRTGAFQWFNSGSNGGKGIHFITKNINDAFLEHHLAHLEENIYRFSKTPNLADDHFSGNASGVALKFKLTGLEAKCGMFAAKMQSAGVYMFKLLGRAWNLKGLAFDPLQCYITFKRNFPVDIQSEAQAITALINAGFPKSKAFELLSFVDDVEEVMQLIEEEKGDIPSLYDTVQEDMEDDAPQDDPGFEDEEEIIPPEGGDDE